MTDAFRESLQSALGNQYALGRELGGGGMSRVFVARDEGLGRDVVVKVLSPTLAQEFSIERFTREIRLAATLQHAHIVPLLSAGAMREGLPFYLMPFVDGESLRDRLLRTRVLSVDETVQTLKDVSRALAYAHGRGVMHRDIKPDNVMLSGGAAVVTDFGIAKALSSARETSGNDDTLTRMGTSIGTPAYMAPEQGTGDPDTDHRADIYALGAMAYEMLSGVTPFGSRPAHALLVAHVAEAPVPVQQHRPDLPAVLATLVMACLAKDPDARPSSATDVLAALDDVGRTGVTTAASASVPKVAKHEATPRRGLRTAALAAACLAVLGGGAWAALRFAKREVVPEGTLLAVMPFNVRDAALPMWREGLVDLLSRSLDGVGTLRTVAASTVIAGAPERADQAAALAIAAKTGAGLVLFGDLDALGRDSVRLRASLYDVGAKRLRADIDIRGESARVDALADTLALRVLRTLATDGGLGNARLYTLGTRSLPALKAFLQGQQFYRRAMVDSARIAYQAAVGEDSTFALAWRGLASLYIRQGRENDPEAQRALDFAIRYKAGRSPRDSLLLRADSLRLAVVRVEFAKTNALDALPSLPALFTTLQDATTRYPSDAELWFELGDARYHFGEYAGVPLSDALTAFERGIALDSSFSVPYFHAFEIAMRAGRAADGARYARLSVPLLAPSTAVYFKALAGIVEPSSEYSAATTALLDSLPGAYIGTALQQLINHSDSAAAAVRLATWQDARAGTRESADSAGLREAIAYAFASRGRFREAISRRGDGMSPTLFYQLVLLGASPRDSAMDRARRTVRNNPAGAASAARLFLEERDTASIDLLLRWADSVDAAATTPARFAPVLRAYRTLARGDSAGALRELLAIPMVQCRNLPCAGGITARLLAAAGRERDAARVLDRWLPSLAPNVTVPAELLYRARLAEKLGDDAGALAAYRKVEMLWSGGDPLVETTVAEARDGIRRLTRR
ncbi:MAG TPA: serine/threonine-protein kinase [Gemmatimonas sp.]|nr:serine/threonine-protein kinase [Gemmatimonas sp.]